MAKKTRRPEELVAHRAELNRKLRLAFLQGAQEHSRREFGRPLSEDELQRVMRRYPGDVPER